MLAGLVRLAVRSYCRFSPLAAGKTQLMFHCQRFVTPHREVVSLNSGGRFNVDLSDNIQRQIYFQGEYEPGITCLIRRTLASGDTFIDIGANTGYYTVVGGLIVGPEGRIHSFEPIPGLFQDLEENSHLNSLSNVDLNQTALQDVEGEVEIHLPAPGNNGSGSAIKRPHHSGGSIRCAASTLDRYLEEKGIGRIRLIKLDIEGAELSALHGMRAVLSMTPAPEIIIEIIPELLEGAGQTDGELYQYLGSLGYESSPIDSWNVHFTKPS
jgi:FkbM family methyltransferase